MRKTGIERRKGRERRGRERSGQDMKVDRTSGIENMTRNTGRVKEGGSQDKCEGER